MSRKLFEYHPVIGYHFIPGIKARIDHEGGGYLVRVNAAGFRCDHELTPEKPPGTKRILIFGDSFTAGDGVSNKDRYSDLLERLLPGTQVLNFGLSGSGTDQQFLIFREYAAGLDYDLAVLAVQAENIRRVANRYRPFADENGRLLLVAKPYYTLDADGRLALHHVPPPKEPIDPEQLPESERQHVDWAGREGNHALLRKAINTLGPWAKTLAQKLTGYQPYPEYDDPDNADWRLMNAVLRNWIGHLKRPVVVFAIPYFAYVEETSSSAGFEARMRELADWPQVIVHQALHDLRQYPKDERRRFRFERDTHPTVSGHKALAESLAKAVRPILQQGGA